MVREVTREQDQVVEALALVHGKSSCKPVGPNSVGAIVAFGITDAGQERGHVRVLPDGTKTEAWPWRHEYRTERETR